MNTGKLKSVYRLIAAGSFDVIGRLLTGKVAGPRGYAR
jgi:hypothetical protein